MIDELKNERIKKLESLKNKGYNAYPARIENSHKIGDALKKFAFFSKIKRRVSLAGRVFGLRKQGGLAFLDIKDESGSIQFVLKKDNLKNFEVISESIDIGDFLNASGKLFKTKKGEQSLEVLACEIITKALRPLPSNWYGLEDTETRLRKRYLDLLAHPELKDLFVKKSVFWDSMRAFLKESGFLEVETPVLENIPGGADAEPFITHYNALDNDFYLRISLEIALKKLMVGGFEKIFEIGRIFRNEGIDQEHLQDYTQLEFYWAYQDYNGLMDFVEKMYKSVIKKTFGSLITFSQEVKINWGKPWPKISYYEIFKEKTGLDLNSASAADLLNKAQSLGLRPDKNLGRGRLIDLLFKKTARQSFVQPAFLIDPPADIEPLAKRSDKNPEKVERFQVMACETELGKGFSEANDPIDQRKRFEEQMKLREAGDKEAQLLDEDFLEALEYGMPPTAGFGVSERLFAILAGKPVRETVFFPPMRPKQ